MGKKRAAGSSMKLKIAGKKSSERRPKKKARLGIKQGAGPLLLAKNKEEEFDFSSDGDDNDGDDIDNEGHGVTTPPTPLSVSEEDDEVGNEDRDSSAVLPDDVEEESEVSTDTSNKAPPSNLGGSNEQALKNNVKLLEANIVARASESQAASSRKEMLPKTFMKLEEESIENGKSTLGQFKFAVSRHKVRTRYKDNYMMVVVASTIVSR